MAANKTREGYREFLTTKDDKSLVLLSVRHPGKKELDTADMEYSGVFNECLLNGLPTQAKMLRSLRENEVISPADEQEIGQLIEDIKALDAQLKTELDAETKKTVTNDRGTKNRRLSQLNREIEAMLAHTADNKAADAQRNFLIACVAEYATPDDKNGTRIWSDVDALLAEKDSALINRILYEYLLCQQNLPSEWESLMSGVDDALKETPKTEPEKPAALKEEQQPPV